MTARRRSRLARVLEVLGADRPRATLAVLAALAMLGSRTAWSQILAILGAGVVGWALFRGPGTAARPAAAVPVSRTVAGASLAVFFALLLGLPLLRQVAGGPALAVFDSFYRAGSLVFGGGHVVLPLLQAEVVPRGWVTNEAFIVGRRLGAAGRVPAFLPPRRRGAALLGVPAPARRIPGGASGHQRRRGRSFAGRPLRPRLDQRHRHPG